MKNVFKQVPLYRFLDYCNEAGLEKEILDCGAGGVCPPLSLFSDHGYKTHGIEFDQNQLDKACTFAKKQSQDLNIEPGDMRSLYFEDASLSYVYSYNSIFHMRKSDVEKSVTEMKRVLKSGGLMFVNFLSTNDHRFGSGPDVGYHEYEQEDDGIPVIHSYYEAQEAEKLFEDMDILYKEDRTLERIYKGELIRQGFIDYILLKK